jgi:hypothetical protein
VFAFTCSNNFWNFLHVKHGFNIHIRGAEQEGSGFRVRPWDLVGYSVDYSHFFFYGIEILTQGFAKQSKSDPHLQFILVWLFWRWGPMNYLPGLVLKLDFPNLSLPSS